MAKLVQRALSTRCASLTELCKIEEGLPATTSYRLFLANQNKAKISPWHHLEPGEPAFETLTQHSSFSFVCEISQGTDAKMEIDTKEMFNPIKQDTFKDGSLRGYPNQIFFNYGALPQTWENPELIDPVVGCVGDNDPLDVIELCGQPIAMGAVVPVRLLGALCLIDQGEVDWKILAVQTHHPSFDAIDDIDGVHRVYPKLVPSIREWLRSYKKIPNRFGYDEKALPKAHAWQVIQEAHAQYIRLRGDKEMVLRHGLWTPD
eukprot:c6802_g1_i1.p1 GENE.c6802_g1_i1~~c6802_g1_i1.p1  ORF type:complete len:261 (+),score=63.84 c6802_g1_i1:47-829(+)